MSHAAVREHYQAAIDDPEALLARIAAAVDAMEGPITARALAPLDQFHVGGLAATAEFARRIGVTADLAVLDAGSGLGGPARYLAETFGCRVQGVDLAPDYVAVSRLLTARARLDDRVDAQVGDLTALPFADASFDLVWSQHVSMNIADRDRLYAETRRVLKPGGRFAFYDPIAADGWPDLIYPVPWAETARASTLLTQPETEAAHAHAGLRLTAFDDVSQTAMGWQQQAPPFPPGGVNATMIVGPRMAEMAANFGRNLREGRLRLVMGVCEAA